MNSDVGTVLVVEDDLIAGDIVGQALNSTKELSSTVVTTLKEAKDFISENFASLKVIVLDVRLPDGDGRDFCSWLREAGITTPIIMLSLLNSPRDIVKALDYGADDYLPKPFSIPELIARIRRLSRHNGLVHLISAGQAAEAV